MITQLGQKKRIQLWKILSTKRRAQNNRAEFINSIIWGHIVDAAGRHPIIEASEPFPRSISIVDHRNPGQARILKLAHHGFVAQPDASVPTFMWRGVSLYLDCALRDGGDMYFALDSYVVAPFAPRWSRSLHQFGDLDLALNFARRVYAFGRRSNLETEY